MLEKGKLERGVTELVDTESLVAEGHLLRKVDRAVDFGRLYEIAEPPYSEGRPGIDPVVPYKIVLLQHPDGIPSLRETLRRAQTAAAYRETIERVFADAREKHGMRYTLYKGSGPGFQLGEA